MSELLVMCENLGIKIIRHSKFCSKIFQMLILKGLSIFPLLSFGLFFHLHLLTSYHISQMKTTKENFRFKEFNRSQQLGGRAGLYIYFVLLFYIPLSGTSLYMTEILLTGTLSLSIKAVSLQDLVLKD